VEEARRRSAAGGSLTDVVRAAGGVVLRESGSRVEVLVVHRPRYDDWSFPKGKAEAGESDEDCAVREVQEETGLRCTLGRELPSTEYTDPKGRPKRVRYWAMKVVGGELAFEHEIDTARWLPPEEATDILSYPRDVDVLEAALAR
jgi:8-oxo-dGTP diphosphatase